MKFLVTISMIMFFATTSFATTCIEKVRELSPLWAGALTQKYSAEISVVELRMAGVMHDAIWRPGFLEQKGENGKNPKPVPPAAIHEGETVEQAFERLSAKYPQGKISIVDGKLTQDINTTSDQIIPELNMKLNGGIAEGYIAAIHNYFQNGSHFDAQALEVLSSALHDVWMEQNKWQIEEPFKALGYENIYSMSVSEILAVIKATPTDFVSKLDEGGQRKWGQFLPYAEMTNEEKQKDRDMVITAVRIYLTGKP